MSFPRIHVIALLILVFVTPIVAQVEEPLDLDAIYRIKDEGLNRSQVMEIASYLTDVYGPRLTGSPNIRNAAEYASRKLNEWEMTNVALETWGPFGRGWTNNFFSAHVTIAGQTYPIIGYPKAWTPGTAGAAEVVIAKIQTPEDIEKYRGQLSGKYVLTADMPEVQALFEAPGRRFSDEDLAVRATLPVRVGRGRGAGTNNRDFEEVRMRFFLDEGVRALLEPSTSSGGTVFVRHGGSWEADADAVPSQVVLAVEHYGRIYRTLQ